MSNNYTPKLNLIQSTKYTISGRVKKIEQGNGSVSVYICSWLK